MGRKTLFVRDRSFFGDDSIVFPEINYRNIHSHFVKTFSKKVSTSKSNFSGISKPVSVFRVDQKQNQKTHHASNEFLNLLKDYDTHSPSRLVHKDTQRVREASPGNRELVPAHAYSKPLNYEEKPNMSKKRQKQSTGTSEPAVKKNKKSQDQDSSNSNSQSQESKVSSLVDVVGLQSQQTECVLSELEGHHEEWTFSSQGMLEDKQKSSQDDEDQKDSPRRKFVSKFLRVPDSPIKTGKKRSKRQPDDCADIVSSLESDIMEAADLVPYLNKKSLLLTAQKQLTSECRVTLDRIDSSRLKEKHKAKEDKKKNATFAKDLIQENSCQNWLLEQIAPSKDMSVTNEGGDSVSGSFSFSLEDSDDVDNREKRLPKEQEICHEEYNDSDCTYDVGHKRKSSKKKTRAVEKQQLQEDAFLKDSLNMEETSRAQSQYLLEETISKKSKHTSDANKAGDDDVDKSIECGRPGKKIKKLKLLDKSSMARDHLKYLSSGSYYNDSEKNKSEKKKKKRKEKSRMEVTSDGTSDSISFTVPDTTETDDSVKNKRKKKHKEEELRPGEKHACGSVNDSEDILVITLEKSDLERECPLKKTKKKKKKKSQKDRGEERKCNTDRKSIDSTEEIQETKEKKKKSKSKKANKEMEEDRMHEKERRKEKKRRKKEKKRRKQEKVTIINELEKNPVHEKIKSKKKVLASHECADSFNKSVIILDGCEKVLKRKKRKKHKNEADFQSGSCATSEKFIDESDQSRDVRAKKSKKKRLKPLDDTDAQDSVNSGQCSVICLDNSDDVNHLNYKKNESKTDDDETSNVVDEEMERKTDDVINNVIDKRKKRKTNDVINNVVNVAKTRKKLKLESKRVVKDTDNAWTIPSTSHTHSTQVAVHHFEHKESYSSSSQKRKGRSNSHEKHPTESDSPELSDDFQPKPSKRRKAEKKSRSCLKGALTVSPENDANSPWHRLSFDSNGPFTLQSEEVHASVSSGTALKSARRPSFQENSISHQIESGGSDANYNLFLRKNGPDTFPSQILSPRPSSTVIESSNETEPLVEGRGNLRGLTQKLPSQLCAYDTISPDNVSNASASEVPTASASAFYSRFQDEEEAQALDTEASDPEEEAQDSDSSSTLIEGRGNLRGLTQKITKKKSVVPLLDEIRQDLGSNDMESQSDIEEPQKISSSTSVSQSPVFPVEENFNESAAIEMEDRGDLRGLTQRMPQSQIKSKELSGAAVCEAERTKDNESKSHPKKSLKEMLASKMASRNLSVSSTSSLLEQPSTVAQTNKEIEPRNDSETALGPAEIKKISKKTNRDSPGIQDNTAKKSKSLDHPKERRFLDDSQFRCTRCKKSFSNITNMCRHDCRDTTKMKVKCDSVKKQALPTHKCDQCGKSYIQRCHLLHHQRAAHLQCRPYVCDTCGMAFSEKQTLVVHQRYMHTGVTPYECNNCSKQFFTSSKLHAHYGKAHNLLKEYHCSKCDLSYFFRSDLLAHESTVHINKIIQAVKRLDGSSRPFV